MNRANLRIVRFGRFVCAGPDRPGECLGGLHVKIVPNAGLATLWRACAMLMLLHGIAALLRSIRLAPASGLLRTAAPAMGAGRALPPVARNILPLLLGAAALVAGLAIPCQAQAEDCEVTFNAQLNLRLRVDTIACPQIHSIFRQVGAPNYQNWMDGQSITTSHAIYSVNTINDGNFVYTYIALREIISP